MMNEELWHSPAFRRRFFILREARFFILHLIDELLFKL